MASVVTINVGLEMLSLSAALALLSLSAVQLHAEPPHLVGSGGKPVTIEVTGLPADAEVVITASEGTIEAVHRSSDRATATLKPPAQRYPQVSLVLVEERSAAGTRFHWLSVPIYGISDLQLETKKNAKVSVQVGARLYDDLIADERGRLQLSIEVPPAVDFAEMVSVDKLGNKTKTRLPLTPPPFPRARAAVRSQVPPSWADAQPTVVEVFAVNRDGTPLQRGAPTATVTRGALTRLVAKTNGVFEASYRAAEKIDDGQAVLEAWVAPDPKKTSQRFAIVGGPPVRLELSVPEKQRAGTGPVEASVRGVDSKGNAANPATFVRVRHAYGESAMKLSDGQLKLVLPDAREGRTQTDVVASAENVSATKSIRLLPGPVASGVLHVDREKIRAGEDALRGEVTLVDAFGNPVPSEELTAELSGARGDVEDRKNGSYAVRIQAEDDAAPGAAAAVVRTKNGVTLSAPLTILPFRKSFGVSLGVVLGGQTNLGALVSGTPNVELAVRAGRSPFELFTRIGGGFSPAVESAHPDNPDVTVVSQLQTIGGAVGARFALPLAGKLELALSGMGGAAHVDYSTTLKGSDPAYEETGSFWAPTATGAAGVHWHVGPGRIVAEGAFTLSRMQQGAFKGAVGGPAVNLGYLVKLY